MIIGIDYSLSCPCMCLGFKPGWNNSEFYYLTTVKKYEGTFFLGQVNGTLHTEDLHEEARYDAISSHFVEVLDRHRIDPAVEVFIEDYSFGSTGRVFHLAENTGLIKWKLWKRGHKINVLAPSSIKKVATGKGNAKKDQMYEAFVKMTGQKIQTMSTGKNIGSPVSDIVDAYFITQQGYTLTQP
jgi:Holliday junction resolvasome RuvABC endonuclease subunit